MTLGIAHPDYLDDIIDYRQFREWREQYIRQPWGELRADLRHAAGVMWLIQPWLKDRAEQPPALMWPYWKENERPDSRAILDWLKAFDAALTPKEGGGYRLTKSHQQIAEEARNGR